VLNPFIGCKKLSLYLASIKPDFTVLVLYKCNEINQRCCRRLYSTVNCVCILVHVKDSVQNV